MAGPSTQTIQDQMRPSHHLIGMEPPLQQHPFHPMATAGNYPSFMPPSTFPMMSPQAPLRPSSTPITIGKFSLLAISFSLMLLGTFMFLGGFLFGIWVAAPKVVQSSGGYLLPSQTSPYYLAPTPYSQERKPQQPHYAGSLGSHLGMAAEEIIEEPFISHAPPVLSPLVRAAQTNVGKYVGQKTEHLIEQELGSAPSFSQQPLLSSPSSPVETHPSSPLSSEIHQLPVLTPPHGNPASTPPSSKAYDEGYTLQLGVYASPENAMALINYLQALNFTAQLTEGKASDGSKMYYVHSGFYKDYSTALKAASQFTSQNIPGAIIIKIKQDKNAL